jgi:TolA-binding protein
VLEADQTEVAVQLSDGSQVALAPRAQIRVRSNRPKVVELELHSGRARFDVRHDTARRFSIQLGGAEVRVLGTRFDLERREQAGGTFVQVSVSEGVVEVERSDRAGKEVARIHASESWSALLPGEPQRAEPEPEPELAPEEAAREEAAPRLKASKPRAVQPEADASELFGQATLARRAGRMKEAAESYHTLLERFPNDARTGVSAFELGRLRMDALNDAAGAIAALERALKAGTSASFREDALARIVVASDALGRTQQCLRARERYAEQYPNGVHKSALAQRCK